MKATFSIALIALALTAQAQIRITEFASGGSAGEFIEITNIGGSAIDLNGWSFDDSSASPGAFSITALGILAAGESGIITEDLAEDFRLAWGLGAGVKIIGDNNQNLSGNGDAMNIFDNFNMLVDTLTYTAQAFPTISNNGAPAVLGTNSYASWTASFVGDSYGSWQNGGGDIGNPGQYSPVPEPATMVALGIGVLALLKKKRK